MLDYYVKTSKLLLFPSRKNDGSKNAYKTYLSQDVCMCENCLEPEPKTASLLSIVILSMISEYNTDEHGVYITRT